jgi:hypothetical protein
MSEASARILRILLACGMIAREEQEIVRGLIRTARPAAFPPRIAPPPQSSRASRARGARKT